MNEVSDSIAKSSSTNMFQENTLSQSQNLAGKNTDNKCVIRKQSASYTNNNSNPTAELAIDQYKKLEDHNKQIVYNELCDQHERNVDEVRVTISAKLQKERAEKGKQSESHSNYNLCYSIDQYNKLEDHNKQIAYNELCYQHERNVDEVGTSPMCWQEEAELAIDQYKKLEDHNKQIAYNELCDQHERNVDEVLTDVLPRT
ncbi:hypothetical protein FF38_03881 [Lucilia cuprina]|uniref:Uncharacterized protein n=1 Tax=Lucilia cuprina TaxID=7375 RepID=A0A0L0CGT5_LUCCU|nr:hypothetical protein FF38_03881 [Lucilia cuprina]